MKNKKLIIAIATTLALSVNAMAQTQVIYDFSSAATVTDASSTVTLSDGTTLSKTVEGDAKDRIFVNGDESNSYWSYYQSALFSQYADARLAVTGLSEGQTVTITTPAGWEWQWTYDNMQLISTDNIEVTTTGTARSFVIGKGVTQLEFKGREDKQWFCVQKLTITDEGYSADIKLKTPTAALAGISSETGFPYYNLSVSNNDLPAGTEVTYEVTGSSYGELDGSTYHFGEPTTVSIVAKAEGCKDSDPLQLTAKQYTVRENAWILEKNGIDSEIPGFSWTGFNWSASGALYFSSGKFTITKDDLGSHDIAVVNDKWGGYTAFMTKDEPTYSGTAASNKWFAPASLTIFTSGQILDEAATENTLTDEENAEITISRSFQKGWNSMVLPFATTAQEIMEMFGTAEVKTLTGVNVSGTTATANFSDAADIAAGTPVLVKMDTEVASPRDYGFTTDVTTDLRGTTVSADGVTLGFTGTYVGADVTDSDLWFITDGNLEFKSSGTAITMEPTRAWFTVECDGEAKVTTLSISFDGGTSTGIKTTTKAIAPAPAYNLAGQRVDNTYRGIVIVNGRKLINK